MRSRIAIGLGGLAVVCLAPAAAAQNGDIPRTPSGHPDLSGTYDVSTRTPMQRPTEYGERQFLTDEEAAEIAAQELQRNIDRQQASDPNRGAPPAGGDGSQGASGNVGGYNSSWIDRGDGAFQIDGQWRTSILIDPPDGRYPPPSAERLAAREAAAAARGADSGGAQTTARRTGSRPGSTPPGPMTTWNSVPLPSAACCRSARRRARR